MLGDCIARSLEAVGYRVTREYYFNNGGRQMRVLGESVRARYLEQLGRAAPPPETARRRGRALAGAASAACRWCSRATATRATTSARSPRACVARHGDALAEEPGEGVFREVAEQQVFGEIRKTLDALGIRFDVYSNEMALYQDGKLEETLADLRMRDLVYESGRRGLAARHRALRSSATAC